MKASWRSAFPLLLLLVIALAPVLLSRDKVYRFDGWSGPHDEDRITTPPASRLSSYAQGKKSRLAVLVTDPSSSWLGLVHGLKTIGVPFTVTQRHEEALKHKVVLAYPTVSGKLLGSSGTQALAAFVRGGGTLVGFEVFGTTPQELFGISNAASADTRKRILLDAQGAQTFQLSAPEELDLPVNGPSAGVATYGYALTKAKALARYDDGQPAIIASKAGKGHTYAFGIDVGAYIAKAYNIRQDAGRKYVNAYEPAVDVFLRMLRHIYRSHEPLAVTLDPVPDGKTASVLITHDIDYMHSIENAIRYAEYERVQGIAATYFIQTKYVRDWNDEIFFNKRGAELTRKLAAMEMEIASHSVSHSRVFSTFPLGSGRESYPDYVPVVTDKWAAKDGTIFGELRVSRFLLESAVPGLNVQSFRPGHLQYPFMLPQAMQATGYRFSSSATSGTVLTHLPFQLTYNRENDAAMPVFEFPITIEDEDDRPMTGRLSKAIDILDKLRRYGGMCVVLIHPSEFGDKFAFLQDFVAQAKNRDVWFGSLEKFGHWWAARNEVTLDVEEAQGRFVIEATVAPAANGLTLVVPAGWKLSNATPAQTKAEQHGERVRLTNASGKIRLHFAAAK